MAKKTQKKTVEKTEALAKPKEISAFDKIDAKMLQSFVDLRYDDRAYGARKVYQIEYHYLDYLIQHDLAVPATPEAEVLFAQYIKQGAEERARVEKELQEIGKRQGWFS